MRVRCRHSAAALVVILLVSIWLLPPLTARTFNADTVGSRCPDRRHFGASFRSHGHFAAEWEGADCGRHGAQWSHRAYGRTLRSTDGQIFQRRQDAFSSGMGRDCDAAAQRRGADRRWWQCLGMRCLVLSGERRALRPFLGHLHSCWEHDDATGRSERHFAAEWRCVDRRRERSIRR